MKRRLLHELVDRLPDPHLAVAQQFLEFLTASPALRTALLAVRDEEPVTEADIAAVRRAEADIREGRTSSHDDVLREFDVE